MNWQPKTEDEVQREQLAPEGLTPFTVLAAEIVQSKSEKNAGKEQLKLKLNLHADDGFDYHVYDYIAPWAMAHKFRHFFVAVGREAEYSKGTVDPAGLVRLEGWCMVGIQKAKGQYGPRNSIVDYKAQDAMPPRPTETTAPEPKPTKQASADADDDVPF